MLIVLHLSLMIAASLCLAAGVGMAMFGRRKKNWLNVHKKLNRIGFIGLITGAITAFASITLAQGDHLDGLHPWIGLTAIVLIGTTLSLGFYSFKARNKTAVRAVHRWSGRLSMLFMIAALVLGIKMIGMS